MPVYLFLHYRQSGINLMIFWYFSQHVYSAGRWWHAQNINASASATVTLLSWLSVLIFCETLDRITLNWRGKYPSFHRGAGFHHSFCLFFFIRKNKIFTSESIWIFFFVPEGIIFPTCCSWFIANSDFLNLFVHL